jgi:competence protein ComEA
LGGIVGTRQELGLVLLLLLLAVLGQVPGLFSIPVCAIQPCRVGMEILGEVPRPGFLCMDLNPNPEVIAAQVGMPSGCSLERPRPGKLFLIHRDSEGNCRIEDSPISGKHFLLAGMLIDLNAARATDLEAIPWIGPVIAQRIVAAREQRGGFSSIKELLAVQGIGEKRLAMIEKFAVVGEKIALIPTGR